MNDDVKAKTINTNDTNIIIMPNKGEIAKHRIVVKEATYEDLFNLRKPGQTFGDLIAELVDERHRQNLITDMETISEEGSFVPLEEAMPQSTGNAQ